MTWGWEQDGERGHETVIEVTFEPTSAGTKMRLVQSVFDPDPRPLISVTSSKRLPDPAADF